MTGPEEFLNERTIVQVRSAVRAHDTEAELSRDLRRQLTMATLGELTAPSLFSTTRCVVVRRFEDLPEESVDGIVGYAQRRPTTSPWCWCTRAARRAAACSPSSARRRA